MRPETVRRATAARLLRGSQLALQKPEVRVEGIGRGLTGRRLASANPFGSRLGLPIPHVPTPNARRRAVRHSRAGRNSRMRPGTFRQEEADLPHGRTAPARHTFGVAEARGRAAPAQCVIPAQAGIQGCGRKPSARRPANRTAARLLRGVLAGRAHRVQVGGGRFSLSHLLTCHYRLRGDATAHKPPLGSHPWRERPRFGRPCRRTPHARGRFSFAACLRPERLRAAGRRS